MKLLNSVLVCLMITIAGSAQQHSDTTSPAIKILNFRLINKSKPDLQRMSQSPPHVQPPPQVPTPPDAGYNIEPQVIVSNPDYTDVKVAVLEVINTGPKAITVIEWDFVHPRVVNRKAELRFNVRSKVKIGPGETREIRKEIPRRDEDRCGVTIVVSNVPVPTDRVRAKGCGAVVNVQRGWDKERVNINRIEYIDGSMWQRM